MPYIDLNINWKLKWDKISIIKRAGAKVCEFQKGLVIQQINGLGKVIKQLAIMF